MTRATAERISRAPTICAVRALRPPESSRFTAASRLAHWSNPQPMTMPSRKERLWENATRPKPLLPRTRDTYGSVISGTTRFPICTRWSARAFWETGCLTASRPRRNRLMSLHSEASAPEQLAQSSAAGAGSGGAEPVLDGTSRRVGLVLEDRQVVGGDVDGGVAVRPGRTVECRRLPRGAPRRVTRRVGATGSGGRHSRSIPR